jgi:endonuclease-8
MPEGPEIRRSADTLQSVLAGRKALGVRFAFPRLKRHEAALSGRRIRAVEPRGKAMLVHFAGDLSIYSHNQLYGEWRVFPGAPPPTHLRERILIRTGAGTGTAVLYSASEIEVRPTGELGSLPYLAKLGPDLLGADIDAAAVLARLREARYARRALASLLLDQSFLAGPGNYLRSEILFAARLHPDLRPGDLDTARLRVLASRTLQITRRAYRTAGITNDTRLAARLRRDGAGFEEYRHAVFERAQLPCYACGTPIRRIERGRALFHCPQCQARPPAS